MAQTQADQAYAAVRGQTIPLAFLLAVSAHPDAVALRWRDGDGWAEWTWQQYADSACRVAAGMAALGVGPARTLSS